MGRDIQRDLQVVDQLQDPFIRRSLKTALHLRRYLVFYAFLAFFVLVLGLFPSLRDDGDDDTNETAGALDVGGGTTEGTGPAAEGSNGVAAPADGAAAPTDGGTASQGPSATTPPPASIQQSLAVTQQAVGTTKAGLPCRPGVRQLPGSAYAVPCTTAFKGNNGGATSFGVTSKTIRIVRRGFPESANSRAVDAVVNQAGGAPEDVVNQIRDVFVKHFDTVFEHYGRKIEWIDWDSQYGDSTDEALSKGREGACADATLIKKELKAFAVVGGNNTAGTVSSVFAECAAERGMMTFGAAPYYPESWYRKYHPWAWGGVMECERISYQVSEYIGKRLMNRKAKWSGDPLMQQQVRHFGTYVPDNDQYQSCVKITNRELKNRWGLKRAGAQYNYALDVSRFPDQAAQAIVQFKAQGVTTIVMACDPISMIFLTQSASRQAYYPEWVNIGVALNDVDNAARLWDPAAIDGHLFGMSQLGSTPKLVGPNSEPGILYRKLTGKNLTAEGVTDGRYWGLVGLYSMFQAAGPLVTPQSIAEGIFRLPPGGGPSYPVGYISYQDGPDGRAGARDHTGIDDTREIYWVATKRSTYDGELGTYVETYGGKRFRNGQWPREEPRVYSNAR